MNKSDTFIGTAGVKRDKTAIHGGQYSRYDTVVMYSGCTVTVYCLILYCMYRGRGRRRRRSRRRRRVHQTG